MDSDNQSLQGEPALLVRVKNGNAQAFTEIVTRYIDDVTKFAYYILQSQDEAEEVAQTVFVWLWDKREYIPTNRPVKSYLLRAARNRCLDQRKSLQIRAKYEADLQYTAQTLLSHSIVGYNSDVPGFTVDKVQEVIDKLPEHRRSALRLRIEDGLSHAEVAEVMGITPQAAQKLISRTITDLRKYFGVGV